MGRKVMIQKYGWIRTVIVKCAMLSVTKYYFIHLFIYILQGINLSDADNEDTRGDDDPYKMLDINLDELVLILIDE